jgi:ADP-ribose pyrophosphatase YjhB (NUDIX family)
MASSKDVVGERAGKAEEDYFQRQEQELRARLRERAAREAALRELGEAAGVEDASTLHVLAELGFDRDTLRVLHLFPLVVVAWADGELAAAEREQIVAAARAQGITAGSPAEDRLNAWLDGRPDDATTERTLAVLRDLHASPGGGTGSPADLLALCQAIAGAAGGFLGLGKVSAAEQAALERIAGALASAHGGAAKKLAGG